MRRLFSLAVAIMLLLPSIGVKAQGLRDPCGDIFDNTGSLNSGQAGRIRSDIARLQEAVGGELEVHVHLVERPILNGRNYSNIDAYSDALDVHCGWLGANSQGLQSNKLVILVTFDPRGVDILSAELMDTYLEMREGTKSYAEHVRDATLIPGLRSGDFAGAIQSTLRSITSHVRNNARGSTTSTGSASRTQSEPVNMTPVLLLLGLVLLGVFVVFGVIPWMKRRKQHQRDLREQKEAAYAARRRSAELVNSFADDAAVAAKVVASTKISAAAEHLGEDGVAALRDRHEQIWKQVSPLSGTFATLNSAFPSEEERDPVVWKRAAQGFGKLESELKVAKQQVDGWDAYIAQEVELAKQAYARPAALVAAMEAAANRVQAVAAQGLDVSKMQTTLDNARAKREAAETAASEKRLTDTNSLSDEVAQLAESAVVAAEALAARRDRLRAHYAEIDARYEQLEELFDTAEAAHTLLSEQHVESSWSHIAGNGTEAEDRFNWANDQFEEFERLVIAQEFDEAEQLLAGVVEALEDVEGLLSAIIEQKNRAEQAKAELGALFDEARRDRQAASTFIRGNTNDIEEEPLLQRLEEIDGQLSDIESEATGLVDYIVIAQRVRRVLQDIDAIHGDAKQQDDAAEALRRRHQRERLEAQEAIRSLQRYLRNHRGDVGSKYHDELARAETYLAEGNRDGDRLLEGIVSYQRAEDEAGQTLREARRTVQRAEEERVAERRREDARLAAIAAEAERQRQIAEATARRARQRSYSSTTSWGTSGYSGSSSTRRTSSGSSGYKKSSSSSFGGGGSRSSRSRSFGGGGRKSSRSKGW